MDGLIEQSFHLLSETAVEWWSLYLSDWTVRWKNSGIKWTWLSILTWICARIYWKWSLSSMPWCPHLRLLHSPGGLLHHRVFAWNSVHPSVTLTAQPVHKVQQAGAYPSTHTGRNKEKDSVTLHTWPQNTDVFKYKCRNENNLSVTFSKTD